MIEYEQKVYFYKPLKFLKIYIFVTSFEDTTTYRASLIEIVQLRMVEENNILEEI